MTRLIVRVRPDQTIDDLDISVVRQRVDDLSGWETTVDDTTLTDATYVTVVAKRDHLTDDAIDDLRDALGDLPQMHAMVWQRSGPELPLTSADPDDIREAAESTDP